MTTFSVVLVFNDSGPEGLEMECESPTAAIGEARSFLAQIVDRLPEQLAEASATVGQGSFYDDETEWLGAWEWSQRNGWSWAPRGVNLS